MDFDAIVIGSGAGGASFAHSLANAGKSTLLIERGQRPQPEANPLDEYSTFVEKKPYDDRRIHVNGKSRRLLMGGMLGGSTSVYGGVMLRPSSDDFHPGRHYNGRLPKELWDWPITYEQLQPYYDRAESLYQLSCRTDQNFGPLNSPHDGVSSNVLPLAPINKRLIAKNRKRGLQPFQLPLTINTKQCELCDNCAGFLCPYSARRTAAGVVDEALATGSLKLMTHTEVEKLETDAAGNVAAVLVKKRDTGETERLTARTYALAAGAIGSTAIMLRSGFSSPQIGRNYMMHFSPIAVGVFPGVTGANETFVKQVGFADFYFGTKRCRNKMGIIQSLPAPGLLFMAHHGLEKWSEGMRIALRRRMLPLVGTIEDLPNPENRVSLNEDGTINLNHKFSKFDHRRGIALGREMKRILRRAGALFIIARRFPSVDHVAHQCGTLRFGNDPEHAVVDPDCRVFGSENLFIVDGSVLPTSMGVGPSLTIAANALRVADAALATI